MACSLSMFLVEPDSHVVGGTVMAAELLSDEDVTKRVRASLDHGPRDAP